MKYKKISAFALSAIIMSFSFPAQANAEYQTDEFDLSKYEEIYDIGISGNIDVPEFNHNVVMGRKNQLYIREYSDAEIAYTTFSHEVIYKTNNLDAFYVQFHDKKALNEDDFKIINETISNISTYAKIDYSTEKDDNGDPFYQVLEARPDSIVFWVKFSTGKAGTKANMSAYITDGTYYQAPEDQVYNNKVGWAENPNIAACTEWTRISVPFTYADNNLEPKAIMLTFSTCATPGGGNGDEVLLVDDVELIYKSANEESGTSYTDDLVVKVNAAGEESSTTLPSSTINISQNTDGTYKLSIKNFALGPGMELGDVVADNLTGETEGEYTTIKMNDVPVTIGGEIGAGLVDLRINLDAKFTADKLYVLIDLNVTRYNQVVNVIFGSPFTETGIDHVSVKNYSGINRVYEIGGQHVNRASVPGLYIINGKKVIKK